MNETNIIIVKSAQAIGPYTTNFNGAGQSYSSAPLPWTLHATLIAAFAIVFLVGFYFGKSWKNST
jgi:hypothetical protein